MKKKMHKLVQNYTVLKQGWFCISCERPVTVEKDDGIELRSYFIKCYPDNGRMCVDCFADTVKEGSN